LNCEQKEDKTDWKDAIKKESKNGKKRYGNSIFRERFVECDYSHVQGMDFNESIAPVLNDVSFRIMLITKFFWDMTSTVVDIETTFL
jgi:hypothetical protein